MSRVAIAAYAMIPRDFEDFIDVVAKLSDDDFKVLWRMLITSNPEHDAATVRVNALGADIARWRAEKLGIA